MRKVFLLGVLVFLLGLGISGWVQAEEGVTDTEIVIGSHQDLSGPIAGWGTQVKLGLEMRAREINEAGGINGRKIRLVIEDNAYDPKKAIMVTNKMITRDQVFAFVGNMGSPTAGATKPIISGKKIPQMFPLTAASLFFDPYDRYSFGGWTPYYDQARSIVKYFVEKKGLTKFGLLYQDDEMGDIMKKGMEDQLAVHKLKPIAEESYKRGDTVFSTQIAKLKKADVQVVVLATVIRETVGALKEIKQLNWNVEAVGMSPAYMHMVLDLCLKSGFSPNGFYATGQTPYIYPDSPIASIRAFCKKHKEWFGKDPDIPTIAGYTGVDFFAKVATKVGKNLTRERWIDAAENYGVYKDEHFGGTDIRFTPTNHQGSFNAILTQVQNNKFVRIADLSYK
ncbi:MAG: ABC transporter substrate-binding protein [Deltaproteobacteria bacterium]|nr:ABC transporter substrate-binding protein [Deltaproteobacteria bacterium]